MVGLKLSDTSAKYKELGLYNSYGIAWNKILSSCISKIVISFVQIQHNERIRSAELTRSAESLLYHQQMIGEMIYKLWSLILCKTTDKLTLLKF